MQRTKLVRPWEERAQAALRTAELARQQERITSSILPEGCKTLTEAKNLYEFRLICAALALEDGSITRAARHLGIHYQSLSYISQARLKKELSGLRSQYRPRPRKKA